VNDTTTFLKSVLIIYFKTERARCGKD